MEEENTNDYIFIQWFPWLQEKIIYRLKKGNASYKSWSKIWSKHETYGGNQWIVDLVGYTWFVQILSFSTTFLIF